MLSVTALNKLLGTTAFRFSLAIIAAFAIAALLLIGYIFPRTNDLLTGQVLQTISAEVRGLREQYDAGGIDQLAAIVQERSRTPGSSLYLLTDHEGRKLAGNLSRMPPEIAPAKPSGIFHYARAGGGGQERRLAVGRPIQVPGGTLLLVGRDIEDQRKFADRMKSVVMSGFAILMLIGLGGGLLASRHILKRIDAVTAASRGIMSGDMTGRIALTGSGDELDRLSGNLNEMFERIEQLMAGLREVSDNIAHDLKTPLNRLRNRAEAALRDPRAGAAYREGLVSIIEEADDLIKTFNALLSIARLEAGAVAENQERIDLAGIVGDVVELYEPVAEIEGFAISFTADHALSVMANRQLIGQAVANLMDNALKYSTSGDGTDNAEPLPANAGHRKAIDVVVRKVDGGAEIVVGDRGSGIAAEDRARVLNRFVRLEASRSRPGSGLGLSLVSAVARLHGGSIRLEDNEPGLRVVIAIPAGHLQDAADEEIAAGAQVGRGREMKGLAHVGRDGDRSAV